MRKVLFICLGLVFLLNSCGSNEKPIEKEKEVKREKVIVDSISLIVLEDNHSLKDSIAFYELASEIFLNREFPDGKEGPREFICDKIYKMVYQTPDSIVPLSRKMDLLQILTYFYRSTINYYTRTFIPYKIREGSEEVKKRPFLLLPFIYENNFSEISPSIVKCILEQDSIQIPKDYLEYSYEVNNYLSTLPKNNLKKAVEKIKTVYVPNPNSKKFFSKAFQKKYSHITGWRII
jgi:hypothetical protein